MNPSSRNPKKNLSEYGGTGTESDAELLRRVREDAAEDAAEEAKHAAIRGRPREPQFRVDDDGETRYGLARLTDDVELRVGSIDNSRGKRRGRRSMFLAFYQRTPGVGDGWSLMGPRVMLDRRQLARCVRTLHEMLNPEQLLAWLDRPETFYDALEFKNRAAFVAYMRSPAGRREFRAAIVILHETWCPADGVERLQGRTIQGETYPCLCDPAYRLEYGPAFLKWAGPRSRRAKVPA